jgi:hypothetical protein
MGGIAESRAARFTSGPRLMNRAFMRRTVCLAFLSLLVGNPTAAADVRAPEPGEIRAEEQRLRGLALELLLERERRVIPISERLRVAGAEICPDDPRPVLGLFGSSEWELMLLGLAPPASRASRVVEILEVVPGHPAAEAGLHPGDTLLEFDGRPVQASGDLDRPPTLLEDMQSFEMTIERSGRRIRLRVPYLAGCFLPARVWTRSGVNAYANPDGILVTTGLLRFVRSDDELAAVLGHEMGHAIAKAWDGVDSERRADTIGLYLAARAGFDIDASGDFWRRFAIRSPFSTGSGRGRPGSHPESSQRIRALEATVREIHEKKRAGLPLVPEVSD